MSKLLFILILIFAHCDEEEYHCLRTHTVVGKLTTGEAPIPWETEDSDFSYRDYMVTEYVDNSCARQEPEVVENAANAVAKYDGLVYILDDPFPYDSPPQKPATPDYSSFSKCKSYISEFGVELDYSKLEITTTWDEIAPKSCDCGFEERGHGPGFPECPGDKGYNPDE